MEMVVEVEADGHGNIRGLSDASAPEKRTISFAPWISGGKGRASNQRKHLLGKLFLFRDRVLVAKTDGGAGGGGGGGDGASDAFDARLLVEEVGQHEAGRRGEAVKASAERSHFRGGDDAVRARHESIECGCMKAEADRASGEVRTSSRS